MKIKIARTKLEGFTVEIFSEHTKPPFRKVLSNHEVELLLSMLEAAKKCDKFVFETDL